MDLVAFHRDLFGQVPGRTPKEFRVTPQQRRLYKGFPQTLGFSLTAEQAKTWKNQERFLGTLVVTLARTRPDEKREVFLFLPWHYEKWAEEQIREAARRAIHYKKGNRGNVELIQRVFQQITLCGKFGQMDKPEYWTAFGFCSEGVLPDWISARLIKAKR